MMGKASPPRSQRTMLPLLSVRFLPTLEVSGIFHSCLTESQDPMARQGSLQDKIEKRIAERGDASFLTREFADLGAERQVLRALAKTVTAGKLVRLGYGVYARAELSPLSGQPMLAARQGFLDASRQALSKLGVSWEPSQWERAYNEGRSTQIPVNAAVRVKSRKFARRLSYRGTPLVLER